MKKQQTEHETAQPEPGNALTVAPAAGELIAAPALLAQFAALAGQGMENVTQDAMAIPFLRLLQAKSPEVENDPDNYKPGMLVHAITGDRYDIREKGGNPLPFLQCHFDKQIVQWGDRDLGRGGLKKRYPCTSAALTKLNNLPRNEKNKILAPDGSGDTLEETAYHYMVLLPASGPVVGVLPLKSTGLTPSKKLMRTVDNQVMTLPGGKTFKPPTFAKVYAIQSFLDKQKTGAQNTFMNVRFALVGTVTDEASFAAAQAFYESIQNGVAKLDDEQEAGQAGHDAADYTDSNVPF